MIGLTINDKIDFSFAIGKPIVRNRPNVGHS